MRQLLKRTGSCKWANSGIDLLHAEPYQDTKSMVILATNRHLEHRKRGGSVVAVMENPRFEYSVGAMG